MKVSERRTKGGRERRGRERERKRERAHLHTNFHPTHMQRDDRWRK